MKYRIAGKFDKIIHFYRNIHPSINKLNISEDYEILTDYSENLSSVTNPCCDYPEW